VAYENVRAAAMLNEQRRSEVRVLVCGGRDYADKAHVFRELDKLGDIEMVIEGGATGADRLGNQWAHINGVHITTCAANWAKYGKRAGPMRNSEMLALNPDLVLAFPGGRGTANMMQQARAAGVKVVDCSPSSGETKP